MMTINKLDFTKYINYIIIAYAFILPLSRAGITFFTISMVTLWLIQGDFKEKFEKLKENMVIIAIVLFITFGYLSLFWTSSVNFAEGALTVSKILRLILLPLLVIVSTLKREYLPKVITAFLAGMLISEILSYGIFFELWTLNHASPGDPTPFMHHLDYSTFLAFTSLLLLNRFFNTDKIKYKIFYFTYFLFVTSNLFLNGGRTGQLAFAISIFAVGFTNIKNKTIAFFTMLALVIGIFYAAYNISPVFKGRFDAGVNEINKIKSASASQYNGSLGLRLGAWIISLDMFIDEPILGTGVGDLYEEFKKYSKNSSKELQIVQTIGEFHNQYVQILVYGGIVGLMLYLLIWYNIFKLKIPDKSYSNLKIIFIVVFTIASLVENLFNNQFPMSLFTLFIGIFIALSTSTKDCKI